MSEFAKVDEERVARSEPEWAAIAAARKAAAAALAKDDAVLEPLRQAPGAGAVLVALAIDIAGKGASLGQLTSALGAATGGGKRARIAALPVRRHAEPYERMRDACDARERTSGKRPGVFLCNLGSIPEHQARAQFAAGFFNAGGLAVTSDDGFADPGAAADAFAQSGAELAAICGSDAAYPEWIERLTPLLRERGACRVIVAGRPGEAEARQRAAGVSDFIYMGCNAVETLQSLLAAVGVET